MEGERMSQKQLRDAIKAVQGDESLDATTKAKRIRALMSASHRLPPVAPAPSSLSQSVELELDRTVTYNKEGVLGCSHYQRKCKILAACCNQLYTCRICHDEKVTGHTINRHATEQVLCMECNTLQPVAEVCMKCQVPFARYFCHICKFYEDTPDKEIYHCKDCGICRIGNTETTFHCFDCGACMRNELRNHKHIDKVLHSDCPICSENMFSSRDSIHYLPCSHSIHYKCFIELYNQGGYGCPICKKSISDFSAMWRRFDRVLAQRPMPAIFANAKTIVLCNDCEAKTEAPFHYLGAKCQGCGSYNTSVTGRLNFPTQEEIIAFDEAERERIAAEVERRREAGEDVDAADVTAEAAGAGAGAEAWNDLDLDFDEDAELDLEAEWALEEGEEDEETEDGEDDSDDATDAADQADPDQQGSPSQN